MLTQVLNQTKPFNIWSGTLLFLISFSFLAVWLPFLRCLFDGASYTYGIDYFGFQIVSSGLQWGYLFVLVQLIFYSLLFYGFFFGNNKTLLTIGLVLWFIHTSGNLGFMLFQEGDIVFHGDTMGVHVSLSAIIAPLALLALFGIYQYWKSPFSAGYSWGRRNRKWLLIFLSPLPLQAIVLYMGQPHETSDEIGVMIAIAQAFLAPLVFIPDNRA